MTSNTLPPRTCVSPFYQESPGTLFLNRRSMFVPKDNVVCHYRLDVAESGTRNNSLPGYRRSTVNVSFNPIKNNTDPYVDSSNWLPKFKNYCRGFLARKEAIELKKKNAAARVIQRVATSYLNPWVQLFHAIRPTLKIVQMDQLKKYLRQCIIDIKKLRAERNFVESQLGEVESIMDQSLQVPDKGHVTVEGRRSPSIFVNLPDTRNSANNETFLAECLDIDLEEYFDVEVVFDPMSCQSSKVHVVYDLTDKLQQKIQEDRLQWLNLQEKCRNLEKEISDLRSTNSTLEINTRTLRGVISKHDLDLQDQRVKVQDYMSILEKNNQDKKALTTKIKELEKMLLAKEEDLVSVNGKCEYFENELESKARLIESLGQDKQRHENKIKELEDKLQYSIENQNELESTLSIQKTRHSDLKMRLSEQIRTTEEELAAVIASSKAQMEQHNEIIELQDEKIKHNEDMIRKLENQIEEARRHNCSDEEIDYDRERKLSLKLKNANESIERMREDLKLMESSNDDLRSHVAELQKSLEMTVEETTEQKRNAERLKAQIESSKSALNDTELKLNRANREKNFHNQKLTQAREKNGELEAELSKLQEDLKHANQTVTTKNREIESLNIDINEIKKVCESKVNAYEKEIIELKNKLEETVSMISVNVDKLKKDNSINDDKIEKLQQQLEEKQIEIDDFDRERLNHQKSLKKLQRRIETQEEIQADNEKTISKLKEQLKSLQEDNESQWHDLSSLDVGSTLDPRLLSREWTVPRSPNTAASSPFGRIEAYSTMPRRGTARNHSHKSQTDS